MAFGAFGWLYAVVAALLDAIFLWHCLRLWSAGSTPRAWKLYGYSLLYLFMLFLAMPIDRILSPR